ncbi:MAG: hypothetical protein HY675_19695 [Chloroflexi bacterium]|nr:hypothetical protein [Chloroflexota bacterium]
MRRLTSLIIAIVLVISILPANALAANDTPETAIPLTPTNAGHSDSLVGNTGGAARFYRIDYAGNARPVVIRLTSVPGWDIAGPRFGFKVYGPNGLLGDAVIEHNETTWTRFVLTVAGTIPGVYLIQVYNFNDNLVVNFNIQAEGLDEATASPDGTPPVATNTRPEGATLITQRVTTTGGALPAKSDGAFQYFTVGYPGAGQPMTVDMRYVPPSMFANSAVGFILYGTDGSIVARGSETFRDAANVTVSLTLSQDAADIMLLQVFNYQPDKEVSYTLVINGAAGNIVDAKDNATPGRAITLSLDASAARGSIPPAREGSFNYYLVSYPGNNRTVIITISADEAAGFSDGSVGFRVYKGAELAGTANSRLNDKGNKRIASLSLSQEEATTFGIQVFSWAAVSQLNYTIFVTALP